MTVDIKPAFQAELIEGEFTRMVTRMNEQVRVITNAAGIERKIVTRKLEQVPETFTQGYMVYFPQGHSMFIPADDEEQLMRLGVLERPVSVDMNSGEIVPDDFDLSPKEIVERKQRNRPRPQQGGIEAAMKG